MEALVNQQLFAIKELKDLQAALEEELEAATSCQEVNVCNLNVSNDREAELVKFCKDLGGSSREQFLKCQKISRKSQRRLLVRKCEWMMRLKKNFCCRLSP
jgi:hypothetical protein